jgi:hypothetical protein
MRLKDYLTPTPAASDSLETWEDVLSKNYRIDTEDKLKIAHLVVESQDQGNVSLEFKCLFIEVVRQTCLKKEERLAQRLFKNSGKKPSIAHVLTETWIGPSMAHIEMKEFTTNVKENLHVVLLKTVMQFLVDCYVIKTAKMITNLKEKQNMDWEKTVNGVLRVATTKHIDGLVSTARKALDRIQRIMHPTAAPSTATKVTAPLAKPGDWGTPDLDEPRGFKIGGFLEKFAGIKQTYPEDTWGGLQGQQERQPFEPIKDPLVEGVWSKTSTESVNKKRPNGKNERSVGSYGPTRGQPSAYDADDAQAQANALIPPDLGTKIAAPVPPKHSDSSIGGYVVQRLSLSL